jgi:hypothetical protein
MKNTYWAILVMGALFIRAHETFTVQNIRAGKYDVRYQNLDSGSLSRIDAFDLKQESRGNGI